jgi:diacylglycerol kinase
MTLLPPSRPGLPGSVEVPAWDTTTPPPGKPRRKWRQKFGDAFRGMKLGIRGHSSFFVHFFFAALVVVAAIVLHCTYLDWCVLLGCIGMVLTAELFNSALETLFHGLDGTTKDRLKSVLDIAAGAVLLASVTALIIGSIVFLHRLATMAGLLPSE